MITDQATKAAPALALKGGLFTLTAIQLYQLDLAAIAAELDNKMQQAPNFFQNAPLVIDIQELKTVTSESLNELIQLLKIKKLIPVGVRGASAEIKEAVIQAGLAILSEAKPQTKPTRSKASIMQEAALRSAPQVRTIAHPVDETESETPHTTGSRLFTTPIRSGQQVYAPNGDLVVLAHVSPGAELLAEGHIHVHGALRGRALAGINGDKSAIIYCKSLEAELVSIAGQYKIIEDLKESDLWKRSVCIKLDHDRLLVEAL